MDDNKSKDTNPKDALGVAKAPFHCVSAAVMLELGLAMMEGGRKYGTHNYRAMGVRGSTYYDAAMRHMMDWWEGTDIDPDSGVHHVTKAIACMVILRDSMIMENWEDDRPIRLPNQLNIDSLNEQAKAIIEKYPVSKMPFIHALPTLKEEVKQEPDNSHDRVACPCVSCVGIRRIEKKVNLGRVGEPWSEFEETYLRYMVESNMTVAVIAKLHKRTNGAIRSRMEHMNLEFKPEVEHEENKITYDNVVARGCVNLDKLCKCRTCRRKWRKNLLP